MRVVAKKILTEIFSLTPARGDVLNYKFQKFSVPLKDQKEGLLKIQEKNQKTFSALIKILWILLIHFIEGNFLNPKIMGTAAQIHPALIVFALVTGEHVAGIAGALLAVPVYSILQTFFFFLKSMVEELEKDRTAAA